MNQHLAKNNGQHLSLEIRIQSSPVKKVSKLLMQHNNVVSSSYSWNELRGLSWIFSEEEEWEGYQV